MLINCFKEVSIPLLISHCCLRSVTSFQLADMQGMVKMSLGFERYTVETLNTGLTSTAN